MGTGKGFIATVLIESNGVYGECGTKINRKREKALLDITHKIIQRLPSNGLIIYPAGFLNTGKRKMAILENYEHKLKPTIKLLRKFRIKDLVVCVGIDGRFGSIYPKDQIGIAINKNGILAISRKFYPIKEEKELIKVAYDGNSLEEGHKRDFSFQGRTYKILVCNDCFYYTRYKTKPTRGVTYITLIHRFTHKCSCEKDICTCGGDASGDVFFSRKGLAGLSMIKKAKVFASAIFFGRSLKNSGWPSGVLWNKGSMNLRHWKYSHNGIKATDEFECPIQEGKAVIRIFNL